jgi:hypothetical protein
MDIFCNAFDTCVVWDEQSIDDGSSKGTASGGAAAQIMVHG